MTMRNLIAASSNSLWYHDFPRKKKHFETYATKYSLSRQWIGQAIQSRETLQAIAAKADEFYKGHEDQRKKAIRGNLQIQLFYPLVTHLLKSSMHYMPFLPPSNVPPPTHCYCLEMPVSMMEFHGTRYFFKANYKTKNLTSSFKPHKKLLQKGFQFINFGNGGYGKYAKFKLVCRCT